MTFRPFLIAAVCALLWEEFAAPAILRTFGVPVGFGWRKDRYQNLNRTQHVWVYGVFMWGLGMFLFFVISPLGAKAPTRIFGALLIWLAGGMAARGLHRTES